MTDAGLDIQMRVLLTVMDQEKLWQGPPGLQAKTSKSWWLELERTEAPEDILQILTSLLKKRRGRPREEWDRQW